MLFETGVSGKAQSASDGGVCTRTAEVAKTACGHEVIANYDIAVGRCLNTSDCAKRAACLVEAQAARTEDRELCAAQFEARADLCDAVGEGPYDPPFDSSDFVNPLR